MREIPRTGNARYVYERNTLKSTGAASDGEVWAAPGAGRRIYINRIEYSTDAAADIQITEGTDAAGTRIVDHEACAPGNLHQVIFPIPAPYALPVNTALNITTNTGNSTIVVHGFEADD